MAASQSATPSPAGQQAPGLDSPDPAPFDRAPRIGIDIRRLNDFGVGTYIKNLLRAFARIRSSETYILIGGEGQFEQLGELHENFKFHRYPRPFDSKRSHVDFFARTRHLNLDVFHMPHRWVPYFVSGAYVATLHDINNILYPSDEASPVRERIRHHMLVHGLRRAAKVIAVSEATKRDAITHLGLASSQIEVVHGAIDEQVAKPVQAAELRETLSRYQIENPFLLYAGRIQPHKNIPRLIEAFAVVRAELENHPRYGNLGLIVIGDDLDSFPAVRHAVMRTRVQDRVRFLGFVPVETLRCFYEAATAFVFPSLYEGFGLPPLEAMAHGTPVVTSSASSLPEAVGDSAVLVNPEHVFDIASGVRQVLLDDGFRDELRRRGFEQVKRFSWDRAARRVLQIYRDVAARR